MFVVTVIFECHEGKGSEFRPLVEKQAMLSMREEEGCRQFDVSFHEKFPDIFFLYEIYDDQDAFQKHLETYHYNDFGSKIKALIKDKTVRVYTQLIQG